MPEVKVSHESITSDDAKVAPIRIPVPEGDYHAVIMGAAVGATRHNPPLAKVSVEFQILHAVTVEGEKPNDEESGRRAWQDYILEPEAAKPDLSATRRFELRQLLDATAVVYTDSGFNTDHLLNKPVIITVKHRTGDKQDDNGNPITFTNVVKVDSATPVDPDSLV